MNLPTASNPASGSPVLIRLEGVGVRYQVTQERIPSIKEYAIRWIKRQVQYNHFWALKDVNLDIHRGEVFGIIGPNGAGKSTMLKLVARVLQPTAGRVRVWGKVAPLLELGAGFDHELTGRENVFLNGALLGFTEADLKKRFDRIVEFAGLKDFIDAPLRTYSTGMVARLGFSIATDVRPEILIVDEILGVGDAEFQTRSYERIQRFMGEGATVLLVTHSLKRVEEICSRAAWLEHGQVLAVGSAKSVVGQYTARTNENESRRLLDENEERTRRKGSEKVIVEKAWLTGSDGELKVVFYPGETLRLHVQYRASETVDNPVFGLAIFRQDGLHITGPNSAQANLDLPVLQGEGILVYEIPALPLLPGKFDFIIALHNRADTEFYQVLEHTCPFRVVAGGDFTREEYGLLTLNGRFSHHPNP